MIHNFAQYSDHVLMQVNLPGYNFLRTRRTGLRASATASFWRNLPRSAGSGSAIKTQEVLNPNLILRKHEVIRMTFNCEDINLPVLLYLSMVWSALKNVEVVKAKMPEEAWSARRTFLSRPGLPLKTQSLARHACHAFV